VIQEQQKPSARKRRKGGVKKKGIIPLREAGSVFTRLIKVKRLFEPDQQDVGQILQ
jgi:hypothetical protein